MAGKSGLESLMEALRNAGEKMGEIPGEEQANGEGVGGGNNRGDRPSIIDIKFDGPKTKKGKVVFAVIAIILILAAYWWWHPAISINSQGVWAVILIVIALPMYVMFSRKRKLYTSGDLKNGIERSASKAKTYRLLLLIPLGILAVYLFGALFSNAIIPGNSEKFSSILKTENSRFEDDIKEVDYSQIPVIDRDSAVLLGNREMGTIPEYVSQFEISNLYSQINYQGKPVRVSPLNYADLFKWFSNRENGIPAYSLVDMTTQKAQIVRLDKPIRYSQSEPLVRNIDRHVQLSHPFYIFDEKSFEIDEQGNPWWICPVRSYTIGLFGGYTINRVVLCNASTGEMQDLAIEDVPEWVDRAFPANVLIEQYNWYGKYHNGWLNSFIGQEGVVRTTPGADNTLGYNYIAKDDDVWVYSGVTSATADDSIIGFVLMNQRTHESHFYSVSGATESSAMQSAEGQVQNLRYTATFPILINVSNQPTYFMALKDSAGLVKKFAMVDIQRYQNVAVGDTVTDTQRSYEQLLATNGVQSTNKELAGLEEVSGKISLYSQVVIDGNSHVYIMVEGKDDMFDFEVKSKLDILKYKVGDEIKFDYSESDGKKTAYFIK